MLADSWVVRGHVWQGSSLRGVLRMVHLAEGDSYVLLRVCAGHQPRCLPALANRKTSCSRVPRAGVYVSPYPSRRDYLFQYSVWPYGSATIRSSIQHLTDQAIRVCLLRNSSCGGQFQYACCVRRFPTSSKWTLYWKLSHSVSRTSRWVIGVTLVGSPCSLPRWPSITVLMGHNAGLVGLGV